MTADLHVMRTTGRSSPLQFGPDLPVMSGGLVRERQHFQPRHEMRDGRQILDPSRRLLRAIMQFAKGNARYAKLLRQRIELVEEGGGIGLHHVNADIGVEHIVEHQKGSRVSAAGCSRPTMKSSLTRGPFRKRSSHLLPCGTITRLRPILRIST